MSHLGGAIAGVVIALMLRPMLLTAHPWIAAAILAPMAVFLYLSRKNPAMLRIGERVAERRDAMSRRSEDVRRRAEEARRRRLQEEMDHLLDVVNERGIQALSARERRRLQEIAEEKKREKW